MSLIEDNQDVTDEASKEVINEWKREVTAVQRSLKAMFNSQFGSTFRSSTCCRCALESSITLPSHMCSSRCIRLAFINKCARNAKFCKPVVSKLNLMVENDLSTNFRQSIAEG